MSPTERPCTTDVTMTVKEWQRQGRALFGDDEMAWAFVCPSCGHVATVQDWYDAGAGVDSAAFSCVGRWLPNPVEAFGQDGGPCNYAGGGLFRINPVLVTREGEPMEPETRRRRAMTDLRTMRVRLVLDIQITAADDHAAGPGYTPLDLIEIHRAAMAAELALGDRYVEQEVTVRQCALHVEDEPE